MSEVDIVSARPRNNFWGFKQWLKTNADYKRLFFYLPHTQFFYEEGHPLKKKKTGGVSKEKFRFSVKTYLKSAKLLSCNQRITFNSFQHLFNLKKNIQNDVLLCVHRWNNLLMETRVLLLILKSRSKLFSVSTLRKVCICSSCIPHLSLAKCIQS